MEANLTRTRVRDRYSDRLFMNVQTYVLGTLIRPR